MGVADPLLQPMKFQSNEDLDRYLQGLVPGERVVETGRSCLQGRFGTVYRGTEGSICVRWDKHEGEDGQMGTSVTGGTRRVCDVGLTSKNDV